MIDVTRMNGSLLTVNNHLIEMVEETPDTVITLTTGKKIIVKETSIVTNGHNLLLCSQL